MPSDVAPRFKTAVTGKLQPVTPALVDVLHQLVRHDYPDEVVSLDFEVFADSFTSSFPVRVFFMDQTNGEHFVEVNGNAEYPSPVDPGLLELACIYDDEFEAAYLAEDDELDTFTLAGEALVPWFFECWKRAGGAAFTRSASIMLHDDARCFDLVRGVWRSRHGLS
jgi:hypothetical protein